MKKGVLKTPVLSLFLINLQAQICNFIKRETLAQVLSRKFCEISKNNFFTEHLWTTASLPTTSTIPFSHSPISKT